MKALREEFLARGVTVACGDRYSIHKIDSVRWTLDTVAAKEQLGEAWVTEHSKITPVTTVRISHLT